MYIHIYNHRSESFLGIYLFYVYVFIIFFFFLFSFFFLFFFICFYAYSLFFSFLIFIYFMFSDFIIFMFFLIFILFIYKSKIKDQRSRTLKTSCSCFNGCYFCDGRGSGFLRSGSFGFFSNRRFSSGINNRRLARISNKF